MTDEQETAPDVPETTLETKDAGTKKGSGEPALSESVQLSTTELNALKMAKMSQDELVMLPNWEQTLSSLVHVQSQQGKTGTRIGQLQEQVKKLEDRIAQQIVDEESSVYGGEQEDSESTELRKEIEKLNQRIESLSEPRIAAPVMDNTLKLTFPEYAEPGDRQEELLTETQNQMANAQRYGRQLDAAAAQSIALQVLEPGRYARMAAKRTGTTSPPPASATPPKMPEKTDRDSLVKETAEDIRKGIL